MHSSMTPSVSFARGGSLRLDRGRPVLPAVAAHEHPAAQRRYDQNGRIAAVHQRQSHQKGDRKGAEARHEPPRHDGQHARDAVDGTLATPRTVRQRRAHRNHEADVSGRQRKFERRGDRNEDRRRSEIHRGADQVVRSAFALLLGQFLETRRHRPLQTGGHDPFVKGIHVHGRANQAARDDRRTVTLLALVLVRQRQLRLRNRQRAARRPQRHDHDRSRREQQQDIGRSVGRQSAHRHGRIARRARHHVGVVTGHGHAHEIHEVVAGEGQRQ